MSMNDYLNVLKSSHCGEDGILDTLFECYISQNGVDTEQIKQGFEPLYETMHDKPLREQDEVIYAACALFSEHQRVSFREGVKIGMRLAQEVGLLDE